jgi:hypothetical protein
MALAAGAEVEEEEDEDDNIDWSDDGPDPEEQAAQERAIVEFFESQKKLQDDARALEEDNDARIRRSVELSLHQEKQQRGGDDAAGRHLVITLRREMRRRTSNDGGEATPGWGHRTHHRAASRLGVR